MGRLYAGRALSGHLRFSLCPVPFARPQLRFTRPPEIRISRLPGSNSAVGLNAALFTFLG